jgi:cell shape-determining protein MreC
MSKSKPRQYWTDGTIVTKEESLVKDYTEGGFDLELFIEMKAYESLKQENKSLKEQLAEVKRISELQRVPSMNSHLALRARLEEAEDVIRFYIWNQDLGDKAKAYGEKWRLK